MKIKALWIDDQPSDDFINYAYLRGIDLDNFKNAEAGIRHLEAHPNCYDALILDATCFTDAKSHKLSTAALTRALFMLARARIDIPWFIYSGGSTDADMSIENAAIGWGERFYDSKLWYQKGDEMDSLLQKIKDVCGNSEIFRLKSQHARIFSWYPNPGKLVEILSYLDPDKARDTKFFEVFRKQLEACVSMSYEIGLLENQPNTIKIVEWSKLLGKKSLPSGIVPPHVQDSLYFVSQNCHAGMHNTSFDKLVTGGDAPYVIRSLIYAFLNILEFMSEVQENYTPQQLRAMVIRITHNLTDNQTQTENEA